MVNGVAHCVELSFESDGNVYCVASVCVSWNIISNIYLYQKKGGGGGNLQYYYHWISHVFGPVSEKWGDLVWLKWRYLVLIYRIPTHLIPLSLYLIKTCWQFRMARQEICALQASNSETSWILLKIKCHFASREDNTQNMNMLIFCTLK